MSDEDISGILEEEKPRSIRGALKRKLQNKYEQYKHEAKEKKALDDYYKFELERQRKLENIRQASTSARTRAREEAKKRFVNKSRPSSGILDTIGSIGSGANKFGDGIASNFDSFMFGGRGAPKPQPSRKRTPKRKPYIKKKKTRRASNHNTGMWGF